MNNVSFVGNLTSSHKEVGEFLFIVVKGLDGSAPTVRFGGKQKEAVQKWGTPGRLVAISGSFGTEINGKVKESFINVAYSRFLDKEKEAASAPVKAEVKVETKAPVKAAKAPTKAAKAAKAAPAPATAANDDVPW